MVEYIIGLTQSYFFWGTAGILLCYPIVLYNLTKNGLSFPGSVLLVTIGIYGGLFGGRILYIVLFFPHLLFLDPLAVISFWRQTGTWLGAPIGIFVFVFITCLAIKEPFWETIGSFTPGMVLAHAISRIGCLMAGCCYGSQSDVPWAIYSDRASCNVHPTALYSMLGEVLSFAFLQYLWKNKKFRPYIFPLYLVLLSTHRFVSEFYRGSDYGISPVPGFRIFQVVCVVLFVIGIIFILFLRKNLKVYSNVE